MSYKTTIGLEVHAELNTESKMFCGCQNQPHGTEPNTYICPVCMAHPGTLPVPNERAIEMVLMFGQAVGAKAATYSEFDRKNYFYPDIPKAYQISQYAFPFLTGGEIKGVELTRVHLEEDTARSQHDKGVGSVVDFNRAGVPLMELVTEPVIHSAETAGSFARELQLILRTLNISTANMEKGEMRVEANISVSKDDTLGTKVEVKNLNSFKSVESAIDYEVRRHIEMLENGEVITQETRGWDEVKLKTFSQRAKETAKDYRYFPDPDIPKMAVDQHETYKASRIAEKMPILPSKKRDLYLNLGLTSDNIEVILANQDIDNYLIELTKILNEDKQLIKLATNYLTSDVSAFISTEEYSLTDLDINHYAELITMLNDDEIGSRVAKDLIPLLFSGNESPKVIAERDGLLQVVDQDAIKELVAEIIAENEAVVEEYKGGKEASLKFLLGQGMKKTKGSVNPQVLEQMLKDAIK